MIRNPHNTTSIFNIERVQKKFSRFLSFKLNTPYTQYDDRLTNQDLLGLEDRRTICDMSALLQQQHNNNIDIDIIHEISFNVPRLNARFPTTFINTGPSLNIKLNKDPVTRLQNAYDQKFSYLDMNATPLNQFIEDAIKVI